MTSTDMKVRAVVAQQAGTWFVANQSGSLDPSECASFLAWLRASPIHVEEYLGVALIAHDLAAAADDPEMPLEALIASARTDHSDVVASLETSLPMQGRNLRRVRAPRRWLLAASMAAMVLALAASAHWWLRDGEFLGLPKSYRTAHGEQTSVQLPDGTELRLNTDSAVTVRYSRSERVVEVARGQAHFEVARDDRRRFRAAAGQVQALAVGTRFDVDRRPDATLVTVVEGIVAVWAGEQPAPGGTGYPPDSRRVLAGYQVRVDSNGVPAHPIPVDVQLAVAWLQQKIAFEQRPLGEVADEFNRYGSIQIEIDDEALRALPISGVFDAYDIDSFVAFLQTLHGVRVERVEARIRVFSVNIAKE